MNCPATNSGYACSNADDHVGDHAARNPRATNGPILHRWPNQPAPGPFAAGGADEAPVPIRLGDTFRYAGVEVVVVALCGPGDAFAVRPGEIGVRAMTHTGGQALGWKPVSTGEYEAAVDLPEFRSLAEPITTPAPADDDTAAEAVAAVTTPHAVFAEADVPGGLALAARAAIADTLAYAARHLEQGDPACDCALHMAVAARAVVTDRAVRGVSSQAGVQALVHRQVPATHSTPGGAADRAPAPPEGTNALVELDRAEARAARAEAVDAVCEAAVRWYDADPDQPDGIAAEEAMSVAVKALKEATDR